VKGGITLAIYIAIGITGAAFGQPKPPNVFEYATSPVPISTHRLPSSDGWLPPDRRTVETVALQPKAPPAVIPPASNLPPIVIDRRGMGGKVHEHRMIFAGYRASGASVELRGPCYSACTFVMSYVGKDKLCIGEGAFMAFHAVRSGETGVRSDAETGLMYQSWPPEIRHWIDRNGGHENLPLHGYWTMYDRDLWAMGYPRCK
jgi:hypothetical protein